MYADRQRDIILLLCTYVNFVYGNTKIWLSVKTKRKCCAINLNFLYQHRLMSEYVQLCSSPQFFYAPWHTHKTRHYHRHIRPSVCLSVCLSALISALATERISVKIYTGHFHENVSRNFTWRPEHVLLLSVKLNSTKAFSWNGNASEC